MSVTTRTDAKGKVYTTRLAKRPVRVLVQACSQTFIGTAHVMAENRLMDDLNDLGNQFLALTDVRVYDQAVQTLLYTTTFLALNKEHVVAIAPLEDLTLERNLGVWLPSLRAALRDNETAKEGMS